MNSLAVLKELQQNLEAIRKGDDVNRRSKLLAELVASTNLFSGTKIREFVRTEIFAQLRQSAADGRESEAGAFFSIAVFQVLAFEQAYFAETFESAEWDELRAGDRESIDRKSTVHLFFQESSFSPVFHLCSFLLAADRSEAKEEGRRFVKRLQLERLEELSLEHKKAFFDLLLNHWRTLEIRAEELDDSTAEVDGKEPLKWSRLIRRFRRGGSELVARCTAAHSNSAVLAFLGTLDPSEHEPSAFGPLLGVVWTWTSSRANFQPPSLEPLFELMDGEEAPKVNSFRLAAAIFADKQKTVIERSALLSFCLSLAVQSAHREALREDIEYAIVVTKSALLSGCISDLLEALHVYRKNASEHGVRRFELEHKLGALCKLMRANKSTNKNLPFVVANNIKAERRPSIAMITLVSSLDRHQTAFLTTNLPPTERQLFSGLMRSTNLIK
ncbi:hypothetical protein M3Y99_00357800 [Aphelenchoides fujianensis]|nr:hypothetical protein M3Y99_00357800 [Aphelenchoides fujianensis]